MIRRFVDRFVEARPALEARFRAAHPESYDAIVSMVVETVTAAEGSDDWKAQPDPERVTVIDHGHYQGTRLFIIGAKGYQPSEYWSIFVDYGSCSGCDSLESTRNYSDEPPTDEQVQDYWTMALHMVQSMREVCRTHEAQE